MIGEQGLAPQLIKKNNVITERNEPAVNGYVQFSINESSMGQNETLHH